MFLSGPAAQPPSHSTAGRIHPEEAGFMSGSAVPKDTTAASGERRRAAAVRLPCSPAACPVQIWLPLAETPSPGPWPHRGRCGAAHGSPRWGGGGRPGRGAANTMTDMSSRMAGGASETAGRDMRPMGTQETPASGAGELAEWQQLVAGWVCKCSSLQVGPGPTGVALLLCRHWLWRHHCHHCHPISDPHGRRHSHAAW